MQKLIFKKDKSLVMSKNGKVTEGKWDYFPEAKSLLIDRGGDKILCNEIFVNEGVLILKMDGTKLDIFALANENIVPDLDVVNYLNNLKYELIEVPKLKIQEEKERKRLEKERKRLEVEKLYEPVEDKTALILAFVLILIVIIAIYVSHFS